MNDTVAALPTVSVVIPAYNAAAHIAVAIDSALAQSVQPLEIIVVDDGSNDDTAALVSSQYPEAILLQQENRGCGPARNTGAAIARGDWLAFLDADDEWLPDKLEKQLSLATDPSVAVINAWGGLRWGLHLGPKISFDVLWKHNVLAVSSTLVRRAAFEAAGRFWSERYCEDYHLWLRLASSGWQIANYPEDLLIYRPAAGSLSQQTERFAAAEVRCIADTARRLAIPTDQLRRRLAISYLRHARGAINAGQYQVARRLLRKSITMHVSLKQLAMLAYVSAPMAPLRAVKSKFARS